MVGVRSIIATGHYLFLYPFLLLTVGAGYQAASARGRHLFWLFSFLVACETATVYPDVLSFFNSAASAVPRRAGDGLRILFRIGDRGFRFWPAGCAVTLSIRFFWPTRARAIRASTAFPIRMFYRKRLFPPPIMETFSPNGRAAFTSRWEQKSCSRNKPGMGWLEAHRRPVACLGGSVLVFNLTGDAEALRWLSAFYAETNRPRRLCRRSGGVQLGSEAQRHPGAKGINQNIHRRSMPPATNV